MTDKQEPNDVIEEALQTYPLAPVPGGLKTRVMRNVRTLPQRPVFVFPWLEASLSLLAAVMLTTAGFFVSSISPVGLRLFAQNLRQLLAGAGGAPLAAALGGLALTGICIAGATVLFASQRPRKVMLRFPPR
jgi:hypothetical protein